MAELEFPLVLELGTAQQLQCPHEVATTRKSSPFRVVGGFSPLNPVPTMELSFNHRRRHSAVFDSQILKGRLVFLRCVILFCRSFEGEIL